MNPRVLTLIKNPELIQLQDLEILNSSISEFPYIQNIRALRLMGIHQFSPELYQQELSKTAAYTTDKKILYHLINKKASSEVQNSSISYEISEPLVETEINRIEDQPLPAEFTPPKPVEIDGVINRILFEGEEDFWEVDHQTIDLESTIESGKLVLNKKSLEEKEYSSEPVQNRFSETDDVEKFSTEIIIPEDKIEEKEAVINDPVEKSFHEIPELKIEGEIIESIKADSDEIPMIESFSTETIIEEDIIAVNEEVVEDSSQISFHGSQEFLPEVKIKPGNSIIEIKEVSKPKLNKHEEEMQLLIAQVEAKMKSLKKDKEAELEIIENNDLNFSENQEITPEAEIKKEEVAEKVEVQEEKIIEEIKPEQTTWKPMNFSGNTPDSFRSKKIDSPKKEISENNIPEKEEERPALNVSFFTPQTQNITPKEKDIIEEKTTENIPENTNNDSSNFPKFLDTWQNWLKIDRKTEIEEVIPEVDKVEVKNNIIETFIQKEPRISKLKEESDFVFKEKDGNISHLMTETLANLYTSQKLYSKAIKAYEILGEKHPDRKEYFLDLIQKVKVLRKNP